MEKIKKAVNIISWIVIIFAGVILFINWQDIPSNVVTHSGFNRVTMGDKTTLISLLVIEIIVNVAFCFKDGIPLIKEMKRTKQPTMLVSVISIILQVTALFVMSAFILLPILK